MLTEIIWLAIRLSSNHFETPGSMAEPVQPLRQQKTHSVFKTLLCMVGHQGYGYARSLSSFWAIGQGIF